MSDNEEKRCPLCAEEMDWTDQQLKPCKCGYQVCVWCWNHIMDMTDDYESGGRCPACRRPYDKEQVQGMETKFERVVSNNLNRKQKPAKAKPKTNEAKKDLSNVRVIQRKIAYVIGLPLSLADEDLLQRKEYFGQYGKVTKVSLSRTAGGAVQEFINDTCSVYVTYSKEDEAVRCIQYVHGFMLQGRFLRASFGTAKYCHAWLRNVPCNNPACLYLHTIGAEEDSFGKDDAAAVHTRNRLQQIAGDSHNLQNRSGNVLPQPIDYWNECNKNPAVKGNPIDLAIDTVNTSNQVVSLFKDKDGGIAKHGKTTTFVDIVARSSSSGSEKDVNVDEDRVFNLCSQSSSVSVDEDYSHEAKESNEMPCEVSSPSHLELPSNGEFKEPFREQSYLMLNGEREVQHEPHIDLIEDLLSFDDQSSKYNDSSSNLHAYCSSVNTFANPTPSDGYNEGKFQSSAKSDRIYRCSNLFSSEEIVEHLRRLDDDDDDDKTNVENSALDAVKSSIISNIMSLDLDVFDELPTLPNNSAGLHHETNGLQSASWNFINNERSSTFSFAMTEGSSSHLTDLDSSFSSISRDLTRGSILQDSLENKEQYSCKPMHNVSRTRSLIPPGFSMPSREPPPGFLDRTDQIARSASGNLSSKTSLPSNHSRTPSGGTMNVTTDVDLMDHAVMNVLRNKSSGSSNLCLDMRSHYASQKSSSLEDEARLWLLMQQSAPHEQQRQVPKFPQIYSQNIPSHQDPRFSSWEDIYGISSRLMMDQQLNNNQYSLTEFPQQRFGLGQISNGCHRPCPDQMQQTDDRGIGEVQRNETSGLNRLLPGYGDHLFHMPSSGDIYTRVFGM